MSEYVPVIRLVILLLISTSGLLMSGRLRAQPAEPQPDTAARLSAATQALAANAAKIQTVTAEGRIRHLQFDRNAITPRTTLDADLSLIYASPSFRLLLQYADTDGEDAPAGDPPQEPAMPAAERGLNHQSILFDGHRVITVEHRRDGSWRGDIYFEFHKQNMLRMAGFPFADPVALWYEPLQIDRSDLLASDITPLAGGGFLGVLTKESYRLKYYFLGDFGYDLRRVSSYRLDEDVPFRDWHLKWQQAQDVYYVERLVRRINQTTDVAAVGAAAALSHEQLELEYHTFTVNPPLDPGAFELSALAVEEGTPFYDHRVNVDGKPKRVWWRDGELTAEAPNALENP